MDVVHLAQASADQSVAAGEFLRLVRVARQESDAWTRDYATNAFVRKCSNASPREWDELKNSFRNDSAEEEYLLKIGMLGHLFSDFSNPNRENERADIIRWLLRTDPTDACLKGPYGFDIDDNWYQAIKPEWVAIVNKQPDDVRVLSNAASFFFRRDKELAEQMYSKCAALEPDNDHWQERLLKMREFHTPRVD